MIICRIFKRGYSHFSLVIFLGFLFCNTNIQGQQYQGIILDAETDDPISYATIGVIGKPVGTVADSNGNFELKINDFVSTNTDKIAVSCVGYQESFFSFQELSQTGVIKLTPRIESLAEVAVSPGKYKTKTTGRSGKGSLGHITFFSKQDTAIDNDLGKEVGTSFVVKKGSILKEFRFFVERNEFFAVKFRLMIYDVHNGRPNELILNEDILISVDNYKTGWIVKDLKPYNLNIRNTNKIAITLQWVYSSEKGTEIKIFSIPAAFPAAKSGFNRSKSYSNWKKESFNPSMKLTYEYRVD